MNKSAKIKEEKEGKRKEEMIRKAFSLDVFWTPLGFLTFLSIGSEFLRLKLGLSIPLAGRSLMDYAFPYGEEKTLTHIPVAAEITWDYWMALAAKLLPSDRSESMNVDL